MAGNFGRVRGENRCHPDGAERFEHARKRNSSGVHAKQRSAERTFDGSASFAQTGRAASALAMVRLGEVGQLEIDRKSLGNAVCIVDRERADQLARFRHQTGFEHVRRRACGRLVTVLDQDPTQTLDHLEESVPFLLHEHAPQQRAERTDVATKGQLLRGISGIGSKLGQPRRLVMLGPEGGLAHGLF